ncbi:zinc-dependent alcohol dehydrogenase [Spirosoma pomorum]
MQHLPASSTVASPLTTTMRAGILSGIQSLAVQQLAIPEPGPGEIRIRMKAVGICGSDVSMFLGHRPDLALPLLIGHEGLGYVDKVGTGVTSLQPGDRVVIEPNYPCGHCAMCWQGRGNICVDKRIMGVRETGCFADYAIAPADFTWPIPDTVQDDDAVVIEPTAVALHTIFSSPARPGDVVAVIGLGAIGLLVTHLAVQMGYRVLAYDRLADKIALAEIFGAVSMPADATTQQLAALWQQANVHTVFECAGAAPALTLAVEAAPRGAYVVVAGLSDKGSTISEFAMTRQGINIITSMIYQHPIDFARTIRLIEQGFIQPGRIISKHLPFEQLPDALVAASRGQHAKIIVHL